ncbi:hypothetical protein [Brachybacterium kimchii]|uniref:3-keto-disaccharide hydrolase domain-containing protein n=1 Tax=Brachybacterium kimchii TaxID=2942909 RepID=A0ABY4N7X0_9MICO|nr:hypothetical protein [Brachybacterium kimchii]UQN30648.1 hypothetical protein M4486_04925 [Brachybacterium kimchii]
MTLQIVVPGVFTAAGLPDLGLLGFTDTFERADTTTLGWTEKPRRAWQVQSTQSTEAGIIGGEAYTRTTSGTTHSVATADAHTADGTFEVTLGAFAAGQFGPAFRVSSHTSAFRLCSIDGALYRLNRVDGSTTTALWNSSGITPTTGDRLKVVLDGASITVYVNGTKATQVTDSFNQMVTRHGFWNNTATTANRIRDIAFTV